jgi:hypothetical protein
VAYRGITTRIWLGLCALGLLLRDEEELAKREEEDNMRTLDVRRERLHELETERLGLTEVCRYETMVGREEEEIGPGGVEINGHEQANGDRSNPISLEDAVEEEPRRPNKPPGDIELMDTDTIEAFRPNCANPGNPPQAAAGRKRRS